MLWLTGWRRPLGSSDRFASDGLAPDVPPFARQPRPLLHPELTVPGLEDLYREIILDHYRNPRNRGELDVPPAHRVEGFGSDRG